MKYTIRLILIFSLCFIAVFVIALIVRLFQLHIGSIQTISVLSGINVELFVSVVFEAFLITIYVSLFLGLSYAARRGIPISSSIMCLVILGMGCTIIVSIGIGLINTPPALSSNKILALGKPGLILSQPDKTIVLLGDPAKGGPQIISVPDRPLEYLALANDQSGVAQVFGLPPGAPRNDAFNFFKSLFYDFDLSAAQFNRWFKEGIIPFFLSVFSLVFLLSSLRVILDISSWPLANIFLGVLAFRGVLALERFLNSQETLQLLTPLLGEWFPQFLISPVVFCILGISSILYTALVHLRRSRRADENY